MYYELSTPRYSLQTEDWSLIEDRIQSYICGDCVKQVMDDNGYKDYSRVSVDDLLGTSCGAELILSRYSDYNEWKEDL